jgi:hypothetical protein
MGWRDRRLFAAWVKRKRPLATFQVNGRTRFACWVRKRSWPRSRAICRCYSACCTPLCAEVQTSSKPGEPVWITYSGCGLHKDPCRIRSAATTKTRPMATSVECIQCGSPFEVRRAGTLNLFPVCPNCDRRNRRQRILFGLCVLVVLEAALVLTLGPVSAVTASLVGVLVILFAVLLSNRSRRCLVSESASASPNKRGLRTLHQANGGRGLQPPPRLVSIRPRPAEPARAPASFDLSYQRPLRYRRRFCRRERRSA